MNMSRRVPLTIASIILLLLVAALPTQAQLFGEPKTKAKLFLDQSEVVPGAVVEGTFQLAMDDHWHTYWRNPGDVGLATTAEWTLPEGWSATEFQWPAPKYIETAGLVNYAYEHEALFPFTLQVPKTATVGEKVELKVHLSWLECEESCVPGEADLSVTLTIAQSSVSTEHGMLIERALAAIPSNREDIVAKLQGRELRLTIPAELKSDNIHFFPDSKDQIVDIAPQTLGNDGSGRFLKLEASEKLTKLSGVITDGGSSFQFEANVTVAAVVEPAANFGTILLTAGAAFLGGLVLNLMPCVFPVLSLKVLGIVEQSNSEGRPAWHHGAVFALGVLISFWVMSGILLIVRAAGQGVGWGYHLQNPLMIGGLAFLFLLIGLNLFGVFEVGENLTQLSGVADKKEGFSHSFWSGVLTTLAATPCTAPFMGGAVGFALAQPAWVAFIIFSSLALGVAAPYMTLTLFPALLEKLPRPGAWMVTFKQVLAFPMLLAVVWLTWVFGSQMGTDRMALFLVALLGLGFASWVYGKWGCSFEPKEQKLGKFFATLSLLGALYTGYAAAQPQQGAELWLDYSPELVTQLKAEGKPFFLDFTADWCTSCKANELVALSRSEVLNKFQELDVTLVKADWTKKDPLITKALAEYKRAGVPLYVLYPGQQAEPVVLPEVLLPSTVLEALETVKK
jgi:thiol:disulfide interchange protein